MAGGDAGGVQRQGPRRAAVLGKPIAHSRSPELHLAAYRALGLDDWRYDRIECDAQELPGLVGSLGDEWVGLSVTMPGKLAALEFAAERTERADAVGSANTLVRTAQGWRADCTDVDGVIGALGELGIDRLDGSSAVVLGAGGTSRPALVALAGLGAGHVTVVARDAQRAQGALDCGAAAGLECDRLGFDDPALREVCGAAAVVVSTLPAGAASEHADRIASAARLLDVVYDPWPTVLAQAVRAAGGTAVGGLAMLLHQAFGQVEQFTGMPAPRAAMRAAVADIVGS